MGGWVGDWVGVAVYLLQQESSYSYQCWEVFLQHIRNILRTEKLLRIHQPTVNLCSKLQQSLGNIQNMFDCM